MGFKIPYDTGFHELNYEMNVVLKIPIGTKLTKNVPWMVLYKVSVFYADRKSKMATTAGNRLTQEPMGKCSNAFYSETTNMIKAKLYMNVHWMALYIVLTPDPMGKIQKYVLL